MGEIHGSHEGGYPHRQIISAGVALQCTRSHGVEHFDNRLLILIASAEILTKDRFAQRGRESAGTHLLRYSLPHTTGPRAFRQCSRVDSIADEVFLEGLSTETKMK